MCLAWRAADSLDRRDVPKFIVSIADPLLSTKLRWHEMQTADAREYQHGCAVQFKPYILSIFPIPALKPICALRRRPLAFSAAPSTELLIYLNCGGGAFDCISVLINFQFQQHAVYIGAI